MTSVPHRLHYSNPFSTRYTRPGSLEFVFAEGESAEQLIDRFAAGGHRGAIIGPHGSGKSTLLQTLLPVFENRGYRPVLIALHDGQRRLPEDWKTRMSSDNDAQEQPVLIIDGYEQLCAWNRWALARHCRRQSWPLLVTSHAPTNLPCLFNPQPTEALLRSITKKLLPEGDSSISAKSLSRAYLQSAGNLRESLFALYDVYEHGNPDIIFGPKTASQKARQAEPRLTRPTTSASENETCQASRHSCRR